MSTRNSHTPSVIIRLVFAVAAFAVVVPARGAGQQATGSSVSGVVTARSSGLPLRGAVVEVPDLGVRTRTNAMGHYRMKNLPARSLTLVARVLGHEEQTHTVRIREETGTRADFSLVELPVRLRAIEVLRERTELGRRLEDNPGSVHVIARDEFEPHTLLFDDVHQLLRRVPGVNVQEEEGYGLRPNIGMRGTGSERSAKVTVMEDGVLIAPAPYSAPSAYYFPVTGRMQAVEVRKGSSQIKYGPWTVGGAVNLVSSSIPDALSLAADVVGGDNSTRKFTGRIGDSYANFGWLVETYQLESDGFKEVDGDFPAGFDIEDYVAKARFNTSPGTAVYQELELKLAHWDERSDETYLGLADSDFAQTPNRRYAASQLDVMKADHQQYQARHFLRAGERFDVTTTLYRNDFKRNWYKLQSVLGTGLHSVLSSPSEFAAALDVLRGGDSDTDALHVRANKRKYFAQGIQTVVGIRFGTRTVFHQIELGARYHHDQEDRLQHEDAFQMVSGRMIQTTAGTPGSQANRVSEATAVSLFAQDEVAVGRFLVTPGIRYEHVDLTREDYATETPVRGAPKRVRDNTVTSLLLGLGASYELAPRLRLFGGVHNGFGPPGPGSDEDTEAERSVNYEVGARLERGGLEAEVVGFFNDYSNILGAATLSSGQGATGEQFNGGDVDVLGVEVSLNAHVAPRRDRALRIPLALAFTLTSAEFKSSFDSEFTPWGNVISGDELPYIPRVQLHASAGVADRRWAATAGATFTSRMRTQAGQGTIMRAESTDPALVVNLSGEFALTPITKLFVSVQNVFDRHYIVARRPAGVRPGMPRTIVAGLRIRS